MLFNAKSINPTTCEVVAAGGGGIVYWFTIFGIGPSPPPGKEIHLYVLVSCAAPGGAGGIFVA